MNNLDGRRIAFLATDGVEQIELIEPWRALRAAGAKTRLVSLAHGTIQGFSHLRPDQAFAVQAALEDAADARTAALEFDALVLPGGVANPDMLRARPAAVAFVRAFFDAGRPVAAICHAPWLLIEAGVAADRTLTSWPSLATDLRNAGANWVDEAVVVDGSLVTSRGPDDLPAFCAELVAQFATDLSATGAAA